MVLLTDNVHTNHAPPAKAALAACGQEVTVLANPTCSSWVNQVAALFSHLQRHLPDNLPSWGTARLAGQRRVEQASLAALPATGTWDGSHRPAAGNHLPTRRPSGPAPERQRHGRRRRRGLLDCQHIVRS
ncbi:MAG: hypothetical protein IT204_19050 [Fimbriimonadaceae bacterium]|nr:hypothetical protein [Fimbriimonadaceae bacterium]